MYSKDAQSFDFRPRSDEGVTSLLINDLQLEISEDGRVLYSWGLAPYAIWEIKDIQPPEFQRGSLFVEDIKIVPGISKSILSSQKWPVFANLKNGWILFGGGLNASEQNISVEFSNNNVAELSKNGQLIGIWLHPESLPI